MTQLQSLQFNIYGKQVEISRDVAVDLAKTILGIKSLRQFKHKLESQSFNQEDIIRPYQEIMDELDERLENDEKAGLINPEF